MERSARETWRKSEPESELREGERKEKKVTFAAIIKARPMRFVELGKGESTLGPVTDGLDHDWANFRLLCHGPCGKNANVDGAAHPCDGTPQPPESVLAKAPLPAEKYGSWMLVSRKPRGNNGRGTKPPGSHPTVRQNGFPGEHRAHVGNQGLHSRFAPLDGLEEDSRDHQQENLFSPSGFQPPSDTLPRIRTNYRGGQRLQNQERPVPHFESEPRTEFPNHQPQMRGDFRGRGGRGRGPNRAAADTDHIVVRGSNRGRNITSTVVHQSRGVSPSPSLADFGNSYKHVPPDQASIQFVSGKWWMISVMWKVERQKQKTKDMGTWWRNKWKILSYMEF
nr:uncharacterized protein LOC109155288 [Ipomoea batatas]